MTLDNVQRGMRTTTLRSWKWTEHWGPQITDRTEWTVTTSGGEIHLRRGSKEISMSREAAGNVVDALSEALDGDDTPSGPPAGESGVSKSPDGRR